jgi:outer membrane protein assembly factor BamB
MLSPVYSDVTAGSGSGNLANYAGSSGGGTLLVYETALNAYDNATLLTCWNSTQAVLSYTIGPGQPQGNVVTWTLPAAGSSINWANGVQWNVSIPVVSSLYTSGLSQTSLATIPGNKAGSQFIIGPLYIATIGQTLILGRMSYLQAEDTNVTELPVVAVDANTGAVLWNMYIPVSAYEEAASSPTYYVGGTDNVFLWYVSDYMQWQAYSVSTGKELWTCTPEENDYATQSIGAVAFAYGNLYQAGYDGYLHCISLSNGTQLWETLGIAGNEEMPESNYPMTTIAIANGMVYASTSKSYETAPAYRGHELMCFNAYTGQELWNVSGEMSIYAIDDGLLLTSNKYDGCVYGFGMGPTATTVSAPQTQITSGTKVIIQGTVTDQTPGIAQGTPAISDTWMSAWMEYLYMDQPMPTQATGVTVQLTAIDPNGNYIVIGNATSDISGAYIYTWTPPNIPGTYHITATFAGSNSYYGSTSETVGTVVVSSAGQTVSPTATPTSVADMYFVPAIAGLFVLIIIVAIVLALLMLRKRP